MEYLALIVLVAAVWLLLAKFGLRRLTVFEYQKAVKYVNGKYTGMLGSGAHWYVPYFTTVQTVDLRPGFITVPGQEVLSADNVSLKASLAVKYKIESPQTALNNVESYHTALYLELQIALRSIAGSLSVDELLEQRDQVGTRLLQRCEPKARELGLQLLSVDVKDIMFPGQLKTIFTEVVKARKEGLAALEKARGETAALRHLANAAQMVERNPALLQLRALQSTGSHTTVLGMPNHSAPIPIKTEGESGGRKGASPPKDVDQ